MRVELEDAPEFGITIDEIESQPTSGLKLPLVLGISFLILVGLLLAGLTPGGEEVAEDASNEDTAVDEPATVRSEPVVPIVAAATDLEVFGSGSVDIVATSNGFIGWVRATPVDQPTIVRSTDGLTWTEVEADVGVNPSGIDLRDLLAELVPTDDSLVLVATEEGFSDRVELCLLYTSPSPRDQRGSRMPSSA